MPQRLVVFVDYQNTYRSARTAFHDHERDPHWYGQVHPSALGALLARVSSDDLELHQVRMYRGMPSNDKDPRGYNAAQQQVLAWKKSPRAHVTTRPLRYPYYDYPKRKPEEKGIDVHIAIDFAMMAVRDEYDVGILMSGDTDLRPALETVSTLHGELEGEEEGNAWGTDIEVLTERLGIDANQIGQQLESLEDARHISIKDNAQTFGNPNEHYGIKLLSEGRRELGEWPADPMAALAVALARALEEASAKSGSPEEQSRRRALAKQLREAGPGIAVTLLLEGINHL